MKPKDSQVDIRRIESQDDWNLEEALKKKRAMVRDGRTVHDLVVVKITNENGEEIPHCGEKMIMGLISFEAPRYGIVPVGWSVWPYPGGLLLGFNDLIDYRKEPLRVAKARWDFYHKKGRR